MFKRFCFTSPEHFYCDILQFKILLYLQAIMYKDSKLTDLESSPSVLSYKHCVKLFLNL